MELNGARHTGFSYTRNVSVGSTVQAINTFDFARYFLMPFKCFRFLRSQKEYTPPEDLTTKLDGLFKSVVGTTAVDHKLGNLQQNFQLLIACEKEFNHAVPNSQLHEMRTLGDVKRFYETTIDLRTPLDRLKSIELPENLHIQHEYHRFHPETDTKFNGVTAFPGRSTYVTGLKYKEKYKGHMQDHKYPCT